MMRALGGAEIDLGGGSGDRLVLGAGANTVVLRNVEVVQSGAGADSVTIAGASAPVTISLGAGSDALTLGDGGITVVTTGVELVRGGAGDDNITATANGGRARLLGGAGDDTITGGNGNDEIQGGSGADRLIGGAGADTFVFTAVSHSPVSAPDTIVNFNPLEGDVMVFAGIGIGGDFNWRGAFEFTARGGAEGRFNEINKTFFIDLDGDGTADMAFLLPGFPPDGFDGHSMIWA
jgi:serralysin